MAEKSEGAEMLITLRAETGVVPFMQILPFVNATKRCKADYGLTF